jgi:hypothetical protein
MKNQVSDVSKADVMVRNKKVSAALLLTSCVCAKGDWAVRLKHSEQWEVLRQSLRHHITANRNLERTKTEESHLMGCYALSLGE